MIKLENVTLRVKQIRGGRYGDFCVGELFHECCELKVKDSFLDQFAEGEYHGTVWINRIFLHQYIAYGKAVTEMRATLHDMQLDSASDAPVETELAEPDPLLESPSLASQTPVRPAPLPAPSTESKTEGSTRLHEGGNMLSTVQTLFDHEALFHIMRRLELRAEIDELQSPDVEEVMALADTVAFRRIQELPAQQSAAAVIAVHARSNPLYRDALKRALPRLDIYGRVQELTGVGLDPDEIPF